MLRYTLFLFLSMHMLNAHAGALDVVECSSDSQNLHSHVTTDSCDACNRQSQQMVPDAKKPSAPKEIEKIISQESQKTLFSSHEKSCFKDLWRGFYGVS